jgi:hypothetical protein
MKIIQISSYQSHVELTAHEITVIQNIFTEIKKDIDHEPEFRTRVAFSYLEAANFISSVKLNYIASFKAMLFLKNIFNEAPNCISANDFEAKIGITPAAATAYLATISAAIKNLANPKNDTE